MYRVPAGASRGLRWGALSLASIMALLAVTTDPADARSRRKRYHVKKQHQHIIHSPRYAAVVVDAKTGSALHQASADSLRHPASLTKIMTLYLLFERLEAGKIKLSTPMEVSEEAASQAPTKLGLKEGQTITVEDAIKGLVTKSANDASVVIAEALAGSEDEFARQMTRKARSLGMNRTIYRNASGLPDGEQVTTAREQAMLGLAIQERCPRYYRYFSTTSFVYRGHAMRNHNRLLGRIDGVDGIKTGYTRASGFNLVTSVKRGQRHIVAVVLGGTSGGQRDARMRSLIEGHIVEAAVKQTATKVAAAPKSEPPAETTAKPRLASAASTPVTITDTPTAIAPTAPPAHNEATAAIPAPRPGSTDPIKPIPVRTFVVKLAPPKVVPAADRAPVQTASLAPVTAAPPVTVAPPAPESKSAAAETPAVPPPGARPGILGVLPAAVAAAGNAIIPSAKASERQRTVLRRGWVIQVGAYEAESEARQKLSAAQSKVLRLLGKADPYTEKTVKGDKTYFRARFAGLDRDQAEAACRELKRSDMACMTLKI